MSIHQSFDPTKDIQVAAPVTLQFDAKPFANKEFALIQLQRIGFKVGQIKVADFERRDDEDNERQKAKSKRELQDWLDRMTLNDYARQLSSYVRDLDDSSAKTEDAINDAINKLKTLDGEGQDVAPAIATLKTARTEIREQRSRLSKISEQLSKARNWNDMRNVATNVQNAASQITNTQQNAQQYTSNLRKVLNATIRAGVYSSGAGYLGVHAFLNRNQPQNSNTNSANTSSGSGSSTNSSTSSSGSTKSTGTNSSTSSSSNHSSANSGKGPTPQEIKRAIIQINLIDMDEKSPDAALKKLVERYGKSDVAKEIRTLKTNTNLSKYDNFLSIINRIKGNSRSGNNANPSPG